MKKLIFILSFVSALFLMPTMSHAQMRAHSINIDKDQYAEDIHIMLSDTVPSKYRYGKFKSYPLANEFATVAIEGHRTYTVICTQASTAEPTINEIKNTLGTNPVPSRDSIGTYKFTDLPGTFTANKTTAEVTIGNATGFVAHAYRQTDSTFIVRVLAKTGIGADLGGTATVTVCVYP